MPNGKKRDGVAVRYEPREILPREIERFLERAWIPWRATRRWRRPWMPDEWMPDMDVFEREGKLVVRADLPGVKREDVQVRIEGETLVLHGHREEDKEVNSHSRMLRRANWSGRSRAIPCWKAGGVRRRSTWQR